MANYIVVSPSQSTSGGNSGDLYFVNSGAVSGATIVGGTGADTIQMIEGGAAGSEVSLGLVGGADTYQLSGITISAAINAGAGGDTITFSGANSVSTLNLGNGNDRIELKGALTMLNGASINGGAGSDILSGSTDSNFSGTVAQMGAGADTIIVSGGTFQSAKFVGGGGADIFELDGDSIDVTVQGGAGGDTIGFTGNFDSGTVQLGDGSDVLTLVGDVSDSGAILGGAGADLLNMSGTTFTNAVGLTVGGGAGQDTIAFDGVVASAGSGAAVLGGGGNDSISFATNLFDVAATTAGAAEFSAGAGFASIYGGAGADSITFTGSVDGSAGQAGILAWNSIDESTLSTQDVISFQKSAGEVAGLLMDFSGTFATGIGSGLTNSKAGISTNGVGFLVSAGDNSSVSERASAMDTLLATGQIGVFKDFSGSAAYIFVQGGTTDLVAQFDVQGASAGTVSLSAQGAASEFKFEFDTTRA